MSSQSAVHLHLDLGAVLAAHEAKGAVDAWVTRHGFGSLAEGLAAADRALGVALRAVEPTAPAPSSPSLASLFEGPAAAQGEGEKAPSPEADTAAGSEDGPIANTWAAMPTVKQHIKVTWLATGREVEGTVLAVDAEARLVTIKSDGGEEFSAREGHTIWVVSDRPKWPPQLSKADYEVYKKAQKAAGTKLADITPWGAWAALQATAPAKAEGPAPDAAYDMPDDLDGEEEEAATAQADGPTETTQALADLPPWSPSLTPVLRQQIRTTSGPIPYRGMVHAVYPTGTFDLVLIGGATHSFGPTTTWEAVADPFPWVSDLAAGTRIEVLSSDGMGNRKGTVTVPNQFDRHGYEAFTWLPDLPGSKEAQATFGRHGVVVLADQTPFVHPTAAVAQPLVPTAPPEWANAPQLTAAPSIGQPVMVWIDHGGWPATGPGRAERVSIVGYTPEGKVRVQLATGPVVEVEQFDVRAAV